MEFWKWFIGDAGAAWIAGLAAVIGLIYSYIQRTKPPIVIIQEIDQQELLSIHPSKKEKVQVTYSDQSGHTHTIQNLLQKEIVIYDLGTKDILDTVEFTLNVSGDSTDKKRSLFEIVFDDTECKYKTTVDDIEKHLNASVTIPYLNAYSPHRHYQRAYLLSDSDINVSLKNGMGKGWSCRYVSSDQIKVAWIKYEKILKFAQIGLSALLIVITIALNILLPNLTLTFDPYDTIRPTVEFNLPGIVIGVPLNSEIAFSTLSSPLLTAVAVILLLSLLLITVSVIFKNYVIYNLYLRCLPPTKFSKKI